MTLGSVVWGFILLVSLPAEFSLRLAFGQGYEQFAPILRLYALDLCHRIFPRSVGVLLLCDRADQTSYSAHSAPEFSSSPLLFIYPSIKLFGVTGAALTVLIANVSSTAYMMYSAWR